MKIGVFDSGMGGLSVLNGLVNLFSDNEYIYVADNKYSPYGTKTDEELINRGLAIIKYFESENTELIIIACNTMSVYLDILQKHTNIKVLGVIKPTVHYVSSLGVSFHKLETRKIDLAPYATISYVDAEISALTEGMGDLQEALLSADAALRNRISVLEAKPFDTYASISYVDEKVAAELDGKNIIKEIYVKGQLVNIVAK